MRGYEGGGRRRTVQIADGALEVVARGELDDAAHAVAVEALDVGVLGRHGGTEKVLAAAEAHSWPLHSNGPPQVARNGPPA